MKQFLVYSAAFLCACASNGNTYPTIAVPWGMNFWTPQTGKTGDR